MAVTIYTLANIATNVVGSNVTITGVLVTNVAWNAPAERMRIRESSNPNFTRQLQLSPDGLLVYRPGILFGIQVEDVMNIAYSCVPTLSWVPVITVQPASASVVHPASHNFSVTATGETSMTYQWQISTNGGTTWSNLTNAGVYSNVTTATMTISDSTGLNGDEYRCVVTNAAGSTNSDAATLTVT